MFQARWSCEAAARIFSVAYRDWQEETLLHMCRVCGAIGLIELVAKLCGRARRIVVGVDTVFLADGWCSTDSKPCGGNGIRHQAASA